jgi:hypothetical protein
MHDIEPASAVGAGPVAGFGPFGTGNRAGLFINAFYDGERKIHRPETPSQARRGI